MDTKSLFVVILMVTPIVLAAWKTSQEGRRQAQELRRGPLHYHKKRHMLPTEPETKRRYTTSRPRSIIRKKPSGHLTPLEEEDMDNDEVVSVAIGPPPIRPKYDRLNWKHPPKTNNNVTNCTQGATNMVRDVLTQLGREFLTHQVNEDFVFGQYVGNAMKNMSSDLKLKMQHEMLDIIVKYQKINRGEPVKLDDKSSYAKEIKPENRNGFTNETDEVWPDFTNLAKIVG